ncbi:MAG: hypothetical protein B6U88_01015 [Candidatus Aenigmarchaeota archaeon ex4484_56]|nr:MAG: hypothetical protein B6U88_01015 [Candidatus Aenigmarchaeota archaeon ex4484_56]
MDKYKKKVFDTIKKFKLVQKNDKIFIALSGGKDSASTAYMISEYVKEKNIDCELYAFYINLNLPEFNEIEKIIKKQSEVLKIPLIICNISKYGINMKKLLKLSRPICSSCGVIKRYLMNKIPKEEGATKVATGHHADDFIVFFIKNILSKNFFWISKFTPLISGDKKRVARIRPLFCVGGEENKKFCDSIDFPYSDKIVCPYSKFRADKNKWHNTITEISKWQKDFRRRITLGISELAELIPGGEETLKECKICGEPTNKEICAFCRIKEAQKNL